MNTLLIASLDTCCGDLILSEDKTLWTCDKCGKKWPMLVTPISTPAGVSATEPDIVMVRREDLERIRGYLFCQKSLPLVGEDRKAAIRIEAALNLSPPPEPDHYPDKG